MIASGLSAVVGAAFAVPCGSSCLAAAQIGPQRCFQPGFLAFWPTAGFFDAGGPGCLFGSLVQIMGRFIAGHGPDMAQPRPGFNGLRRFAGLLKGNMEYDPGRSCFWLARRGPLWQVLPRSGGVNLLVPFRSKLL